MANGHGGARPGAGRKCNPQLAHMRALIGAVITEDDWVNIIKGIIDDARSGNLRSVSFLLSVHHGLSIQSFVETEDAAPRSEFTEPPRLAEGQKPDGIPPAATPTKRIIHDLRKPAST